jgi:NAD+ kinase
MDTATQGVETLKWKGGDRPAIMIFGNDNKLGPEFRERAMSFLDKRCIVAKMTEGPEDKFVPAPWMNDVDFTIVFGGDGTMLRAAKEIAWSGVPVIGVNLGTVGFLTEISPSEFEDKMDLVLAGEGKVSQRMMLECKAGGESFSAINDMVINSHGQVTLDFEISIDGIEVADFRGDGLIIATPSGSTGYNLSAGGPLISPGVQAIAVTAICAHSLTTRPVVVNDKEVIKVRMPTDSYRGHEPVLIADGEVVRDLEPGEEIEVRRHEELSFNLLQLEPNRHYQTMRDKLHWGRSVKHLQK